MAETKDNPPPITEPTKRAGHEIEKGWPHLKAAWRAVLAVAVLAFLLGFGLAWQLVVASKNATIETLTTASKEKDSKIELLQKDNEKLQRQNVELKTVLTEFTAPLKNRTLILASQLKGFVQQRHPGESLMECREQYESRFPLRNERMVQQLDDVGQHSDTLTKTLHDMQFYDPSAFLANVMILSKEFERLANNLKE
jgi:hypothetical protein